MSNYTEMTDEDLFKEVNDSFDDAGAVGALDEIQERLKKAKAEVAKAWGEDIVERAEKAEAQAAGLRAAVETMRRTAVEALS